MIIFFPLSIWTLEMTIDKGLYKEALVKSTHITTRMSDRAGFYGLVQHLLRFQSDFLKMKLGYPVVPNVWNQICVELMNE